MVDIGKIKDAIREGINEFICQHFFKNPFNYLYERDIQSHLFCILRKKVSEEYPISIINESKKTSIQVKNYLLNLIYTEYSQNKIDLVCLDPNKAIGLQAYKASTGINIDQDPLWDQPLLLGMEIKYIKPGYEKNYQVFKKDIEKMKDYKKTRKNYSSKFEYCVLSFMLEPGRLVDTIKKLAAPVNKIEQFDAAYVIADETIYQVDLQ